MALERINVVPHHSGRGFSIPFTNGKIDVPDTPGGYCISSGCGSGKTEACKSLIRQRFNNGILYAVDTISECEKMYQWVKEELVDKGLLSESDVMMVHSQAPLESMKTYLDNPEKICQVKVLIVVQVRFFVELINYFLIYRPVTSIDPFDGDFKRLMSRADIRKYIIFDETPLFLKPFASLCKGDLAPYATLRRGVWVCKSESEVKHIYDTFIKGSKLDYNKKDNAMNRIKNSVILKAIPLKFNGWMARKDKCCDIQYFPADLVQTGMNSHVLVFEGAGDVLLGKGSKFTLMDIPFKYNSRVKFIPFPFVLNRRTEPDNTQYDNFIKSVADILRLVNGKTLVVIWKDFKTTEVLSEIPNDKYTEKLKESLISSGIPESAFSVTYYGAADTKSCNDYREYENIILAGRWILGKTVVRKLETAFSCKSASMENYMMWYYIQLLLRIGIRNNSMGEYRVYYSSDHDDSFIGRIEAYLNYNYLSLIPVPKGTPFWKIFVTRFKKGDHYLKEIEKLVDYDSEIKDAIENRRAYTTSITLGEIGKLIPKKKKLQVDNYKNLISFLDKIGITLNITRGP